MKIKDIILILVACGLIMLPILFVNANFEGADSQAEEMISQVSPNYQPWFKPFWEPPSGEIESLLFALQASVGSAIIFYIVGYVNGIKKRKNLQYKR